MADNTSTNDLTYTPTTWADGADGGTAITADRLNNIEQGINNATTQVNANTKDIKTLGGSVSLSLGTMLTFNNGFSLRGGFAYRKNGVIYFDIGISCTTAQKAGVIFHPFEINGGYRPKIGAFGGSNDVYSRFTLDGIVYCYPIASSTSYWIAGSYLVE